MDNDRATVDLTEANFAQAIKQGIVLLDFWAAWCGPCRMFAPIFEAAARRHPDVTFAKVDTEAEPRLAAAFDVRAIPTLVALRDGVMLLQQPGALPGQVLDQLLGEIKALDMDAIQKETA